MSFCLDGDQAEYAKAALASTVVGPLALVPRCTHTKDSRIRVLLFLFPPDALELISDPTRQQLIFWPNSANRLVEKHHSHYKTRNYGP